jgi:hypothetical protein
MSRQQFDAWAVPFLFLFFVFRLVCAISYILAAVGGWRRIAKTFPARDRPDGKWHYMQSGMVGVVSYGSGLIVCSSIAGLYVAVLPMFRLAHPPLFLPWKEINVRMVRRFLWVETVWFYVGSPVIGTLQLPKRVFEGHLSIES